MAQVDEMPVGRSAIDGEYWHMGETTMRLRSVRRRRARGVKRALVMDS